MSRIIGLPIPTQDNEAATKKYVDDTVSNNGSSVDLSGLLPKSGGTMTGAIAMGNNKITGLATPTATTDAATKAYVDSAVSTSAVDISGLLQKTGGTMTGAIAMSNNKITGLGTPTANADAATKAYVDSAVSSSTPVLKGSLSLLSNVLSNSFNGDTNNYFSAAKVSGYYNVIGSRLIFINYIIQFTLTKQIPANTELWIYFTGSGILQSNTLLGHITGVINGNTRGYFGISSFEPSSSGSILLRLMNITASSSSGSYFAKGTGFIFNYNSASELPR